ncbi:hypothetical protein D3C81_1542730 [compost metagenome]
MIRRRQRHVLAIALHLRLDERLDIAGIGRRDADGQLVAGVGDARHARIGHDQELLLLVEGLQREDAARVRHEDRRGLVLLHQPAAVDGGFGGRVLVIQRDHFQLDLLALDLKARDVDLVHRHLHARQHVLAIQRGPAGQRAGIADLDDFLRQRGARSQHRGHCGGGQREDTAHDVALHCYVS